MRIICFGDSNTYGYDPRDFFGGRYDACWVDLLAKQTGWTLINAGVNGRVIPSTPVPLPAHDLFLVMLGTNDLLQGTAAAEASARMKRFLMQMRPHCRQILLIAPPAMKRGAWVPTDSLVDESIRLAAEYCLLARELDIPCVDTRGWDIDLCFDGVHFTENGHRTFAASVCKKLLTLPRRHGL